MQTAPPDQSFGLRRLIPLHDRKTEIGPLVKAAVRVGQERIDRGAGGRLLRPRHPRGQVGQAGIAPSAATSSGPSECRWRRSSTGPALIWLTRSTGTSLS